MTAQERFQRVERIFHELETMPEADREQRLAALAIDDADMASELRAMLSAPTAVERRLDAMESAAHAVRAQPPAADDPEMLGPYRLLKVLGEGGMGRVYLAEQTLPVHRTVALKIMRRGLDVQEAAARFRAERQALAVLEHPNIAGVLDAGSSEDGRPWFAMEYIDGITITRWAEQRRLDLRQRIELLLPVCAAVQHAHRKGLIHRDLKPSNLLVMDDGALGHPKIIDFGIAKLIELPQQGRSFATSFGALVGTPEYMSPEQAALGDVDIDTRVDVYALGLVLHELLVGGLPLGANDLRKLAFQEMCRRVRETEVPKPSLAPLLDDRPSQWRRMLIGDLDSVLMKALAKDREQRYDSVDAFAEDLRRYLSDQPVLAQPPTLRYRVGKFVRRHRLPVAAATVAVLALLIGGSLATYGLLQSREALTRAEWNLEEAELRNSIANAYADSLRLIFGGGADVDVLSRKLMAHATDRWRTRAEDPDGAAMASFAIGRHFLSRNDYANAKAVFEPWLAEDIGPKELRSYGWQLLGFAYRYTGEPDKALNSFRRAGDLAHPFTQNTVGWASRLTQIALLSKNADDQEAAGQTIHRLLDEVDGPTLQVSLLNSLYQLQVSANHPDAAYEAMRRAVAVIDANPSMDLAGRDTNRLNLARLTLYNRRDVPAALALITKVRSGDMQAKGESRETALALEIEAAAMHMSGHPERTLEAAQQAMPIYARYVGAQAIELRRCQMLMVFALTELARYDDARALVSTLHASVVEHDPHAAIADTYLTLHAEGPQSAQSVLERYPVDADKVRRADYLRYIIEAFAKAGLVIPTDAESADA